MPSHSDRARGFAWLALGAFCVASLLLAGCSVDRRQQSTQAPPQPVEPYIPEAPPAPEPEAALVNEFGFGPYDLTPPPGEWPVTRVALLLPLSGRHASVGQAMLNAAQLALFDIADDRFALVIRDTQGTPEGARLAVRSAFEERVGLILGPLFATSARAIAEDTQFVGINVITFSNDRSAAGSNIFIAGLPPEDQVARVIDYALRFGAQRFAVLAPQTSYGTTVVNAARAAVLGQGAELTRIVPYNPAAGDISPEVRILAQYDARHQALLAERKKLEALEDEASVLALKRLENLDTLGAPDFDAVLLPIGGSSLRSIAPSLAYYDVDPAEVRFLGTALWNDPSLGSEPTLIGGWFAAPTPVKWAGFRQRYLEAFGSEPPRIASLAYDLMALAAVLARSTAGPGRAADYSFARLSQPSGFSGIDGLFRFGEDGVVQRGLSVLEIGRKELRELEPAPQSFEGFIN